MRSENGQFPVSGLQQVDRAVPLDQPPVVGEEYLLVVFRDGRGDRLHRYDSQRYDTQ